MPAPECLHHLMMTLWLPGAGPVVGYVAGPGAEFIPYFLGLLAFAGTALFAIVLWPFRALLRQLRRGKAVPSVRQGDDPAPAAAPELPESSGVGRP